MNGRVEIITGPERRRHWSEEVKLCRDDLTAADLEVWMREQRANLSHRNDIAKAMDYMLKRWPSFTRFLNDGRVCLSNAQVMVVRRLRSRRPTRRCHV